MSKIKKIFGCILVTLIMWAIARFVPSLISMIDPGSTMLKAIALIAMLPIGWLAAKAVSKERFCGCIRANLYVFAFIETTGILDTVTYLWQNLAFYTGRLTTDANGIAYSDYLLIFGGTILFEIVYIALCIYFAKKTTKATDEKTVVVNTEALPDPAPAVDATIEETPDKEVVETSNRVRESNPVVLAKPSKQRYCKYCGGAIDGETKKCTKCGKQYFRIKVKKGAVLAALALGIIAGLVTLNIYQYSKYQKHIAVLRDKYARLQEDCSELEEEIGKRNTQIAQLEVQRTNLAEQAEQYENVWAQLENLAIGNIGYAAYNFKADESVIVVHKGQENRKFTLTAYWSNGGSVSVSYSSLAARVSFDNEEWSYSTTMTVDPYSEGVTVVTFKNDVDSATFKILIIVLE